MVHKCFSIACRLNKIKNPLQLEDGTFDSISNISTPKDFKWVKGGSKVADIGVIGY